MDLEQSLQRIAQQEARVLLVHFDATLAWDLANALRDRAIEQKLEIAFDISFAGTTYVYASMNGATPDNADWIRRKKNVVQRFHRSSYALLLECEKRGLSLAERYGCDPRDFVAAGGCFPLRVRGSSGVLGSMTVSGLSGREDHELVVEVLGERLGVDLTSL